METISFEDFKKVEIAVGEIQTVEKIEGSEKLLRLMVNFAESEPRQIISGISKYYSDPSLLVGKKCMFVLNLEPRTIFGFESKGMLLAVSTEDGLFSILEPNGSIPAGTRAK